MSEKSRFTVSADWVQKQLGAPEFRIVDAAWYLPAQGRNGAVEYSEGHVPGAVFFDQDAIADHSSTLPHTIPSPDEFADAVGKLGIADTDTIVVYDGPGFFTAPRVWWLFRTMGAERVFVMEGGIDGWKKEGRPLETDLPEPAPATFKPHFAAEKVTWISDMRSIVSGDEVQIADARSPGRFAGRDAEPRAGVRGGHMPGARNVPVTALSENGRLKDIDSLKALFSEAGIDLSRPVVTTCGSGITAAAITFALHSVGHEQNTLFDGSWTEWGSLEDTPVETGDPVKTGEA